MGEDGAGPSHAARACATAFAASEGANALTAFLGPIVEKRRRAPS